MKLSVYAKKLGVSYRTVWRLYKAGKLDAYSLPTGTIIVRDENIVKLPNKVCIYARVSSSENKDNLERQATRLQEYAITKGYQIRRVVKEVASGVNDNRKQLLKLLRSKDYRIIIVEHKERLARFGFNFLLLLAEEQGKTIEVVNESSDEKIDLIQDFISIITSFCTRLYGLGRSKRKTEKIIKELIYEKKC